MSDVEKMRVCKQCGTTLDNDEKKFCKACADGRKKIFHHRLKVGFSIAAIVGVGVYLLHSLSGSINSTDELLADLTPAEKSNDELVETNIMPEEIPEYPSGQRYWNKQTQNWEIDGKPYRYQVSFWDLRSNSQMVLDYDDIDFGYEDYEYYKKQWYATNTSWNLVAPE